jgi:hypothetical protein
MDVGMAEAGQMCDEPMHREKRDALTRTLWHRSWLVGISPWQMDVDHDGQDATSVGRLLGHVAALIWACLARVT